MTTATRLPEAELPDLQDGPARQESAVSVDTAVGTDFDAIVVGAGIMGAFAARELARRGQRVLLLDRHSLFHARGSSHGDSRMTRLAYSEHSDYVPLLQEARQGWLNLQQAVGFRLLDPCGALFLGSPESDLLSGALKAASVHGLAHERLSRSDLAHRFPHFSPEPDWEGFLDLGGGSLYAHHGWLAAVEDARRHGAALAAFARVTGLDRASGRWEVATEAGTYHAGRLVLCPGPWINELLEPLGFRLPLTVTRQVVSYLGTDRPELFESPAFPAWALIDPAGRMFYGLPRQSPALGVKVAIHAKGRAADPDSLDREPRPEEIAETEAIRPYLPGLNRPVVEALVCLYTNTPDGHFVLDRHPGEEGLVYASPCSGHGFKFAPVVGQALADLALTGGTDLPVGFLSAERFRRDEPPAEGGQTLADWRNQKVEDWLRRRLEG